MKNPEILKEARRRYYLHHRLRTRDYVVIAHKRKIEIPYTEFQEGIPEPFKRYLSELTQKNYSIQSVII